MLSIEVPTHAIHFIRTQSKFFYKIIIVILSQKEYCDIICVNRRLDTKSKR